MNKDAIEKIVREYIDKTVHMSLATVNGDRPWVCEVHFAYDEGLNLYFVSEQTTRHCREIAANPHIAGNIIKQHPVTEAPHGVYFEGAAAIIEATDEDAERYCTALHRDVDELKNRLKEPGRQRMYKIQVSNWAIFGDFDGTGTAKHELNWGRA